MPFTTVNVTSGSGRGNIEISVATSKKSQAVQKGSDEGKNGTQSEGASERVMGVEKRYVSINTELSIFLCTCLRECCRQVEAEVISNSRNKLHQTTYKEIFSAV